MKNFFKFIISILIPQFAGIVGSFFTTSAIEEWYVHLEKPFLTPPNWIFAPAWITLYFLMGISLFLVWKKGGEKKAFLVFGFQLFLNAVWSIVFFGLQNPFFALINIFLLLIVILWTMILFYKTSKASAYLLVPYLLWTGFASYLNLFIWTLN